MLGTSHVEAAGLLLWPEGDESRVERSGTESSGNEGLLTLYFSTQASVLFTVQQWLYGSLLDQFVTP